MVLNNSKQQQALTTALSSQSFSNPPTRTVHFATKPDIAIITPRQDPKNGPKLNYRPLTQPFTSKDKVIFEQENR